MKQLALAALLLSISLVVTSAQPKALFQPLLDHKASHELTWTFSEPVKSWGKEDLNQIAVNCDGKAISEFTLQWSNAQTLKVLLKKNLNPGHKCTARLMLPEVKEDFSFDVPLVKVEQAFPWGFDTLDEDTVFGLALEAPVDPAALAALAYVEVEGSSEKVELDPGTEDEVKEIKKRTYSVESFVVVLKPRRKFPFDKDIVLVVPEKYTFAFRREGHIRAPFRATLRCERTNPTAPCSPLGEIGLEFNSHVKPTDLKNIRLIQGKNTFKLRDIKSETNSASFDVKLLATTEYKVELPSGFIDSDRRPLSNANKFPLTFSTGDLPPLAKFAAPFGVLESEAEPILPVTVRNIEKVVRLRKTATVLRPTSAKDIQDWLNAVRERQNQGYGDNDLRAKSVFEGRGVHGKDETISYTRSKNESEVLGLPLKEKGLHIVELSSDAMGTALLGANRRFFVSTAVLVTNMAAHLKLGQTNSLVWVTTLDKGLPMNGATVKLFDCKGALVETVTTNKTGYAWLKATKDLNGCSYDPFMVIATRGDDMTFTQSSWSEGIEGWRFGINQVYSGHRKEKSHTVFDRPVYKSGEKVHMLHLLRRDSDKGLAGPLKTFSHLRIQHYESDKNWYLPLKWKDPGLATSEFELPEGAPQGSYYVALANYDGKRVLDSLSAGNFQVKAFRLPLMKSTLSFVDNKNQFGHGDDIKLLGHVELLSGSPSQDTPITLRTEVHKTGSLYVDGYPDFTFLVGKPGQDHDNKTISLEKMAAKSDEKGDFSFLLKGIPKSDLAQNVVFEIEYMDPNGAFQNNSATALVYPNPEFVGIKHPKAPLKVGEEMNFKVLVVDLKDRPLKNVKFQGTLLEEVTTSSRKKILGGFYTYDSTERISELGKVCEGKTDAQGFADCQFKVKDGGQFYLNVTTPRSEGYTRLSLYSSGNWQDQEHHDRMDLLADKETYLPGDTAKLELKMPFETATVLVTKERFGIKTTTVATVERKSPFVLVPLDRTDFPDVVVSVLAIRGRIGEGQATGTVDLARPAYRLGLKNLTLEKVEHLSDVEVVTDKAIYQTREKVKVRIKVTNRDKSPVKNTRVALSVIDEGLLLISNRTTFDASALFRSMGHGVTTSTVQTHVIGKRHFGLKARPHGGGGGQEQGPRELFDTLLHWAPEIELNEKGEATLEFSLNDSLTSFRIYALAYSMDRFGTSHKSITATKDVIAYNGTSPEIRTGDSFSAAYTIKNTTSSAKKLSAVLTLNGQPLKAEEVTLASGASHLLKAPVSPFKEAGTATYVLTVKEAGKKVDEIRTTQKVLPLSVATAKYSDLKQLSGPVTIAGSSEPRLDRIEMLLSPTLLPGLEILRDYMELYPYSCLEQQVARAVIMEDKKLLKKIGTSLSSFIDGRGFLKFYPSAQARGFLPLSAHVLEVMTWNKTELDGLKDVEAGLVKFVEGKQRDLDAWEIQNFEALKLRALAALKIRRGKLEPAWIKDVPAPHGSDSLMALLHKWVVFYPDASATAAQDILRTKLKIDGSTVMFLGSDYRPDFIFSTEQILYSRMLLIQKTMGLQNEFGKFFKDNEGKFIRGLLGLRQSGYFPETTTNTYVFLLFKRWETPAVSGITKVATEKSTWKENAAAPLVLKGEKGKTNHTLTHEGKGAPWADIRYMVFPDPSEKTARGVDMTVTFSKVEGKGDWKVQDRIVADVTIIARNDVSMPAVTLAIPSGSTIIGLETGQSWLEHEERTEVYWRGYYRYLQKGEHKFRVTFRLNQAGTFEVPGARLEAMYSPDISAQLPYWRAEIK